MLYNMRHAFNTMFCLLSVSCLVGELFCIDTTIMPLVFYINRQPGRGYHYSKTNAWGERAASKKSQNPRNSECIQVPSVHKVLHTKEKQHSLLLLLLFVVERG